MRWRLSIAAVLVALVAAIGSWTQSGHAANDTTDSRTYAHSCEELGPAGGSLHRAGLVIVFGGGRTVESCTEFSEDSISGAELLERSGLEIVFSSGGGFGAGICRIDATGCSDPRDCFCQCRGSDCAYWAYWTFADGAWRYQQLGASQREVRDGDVDAWVWGNGRSAPARAGGPCPTVAPSPPRPQRTQTAASAQPTPQPTGGGVAGPNSVASPQANASLSATRAKVTETRNAPEVVTTAWPVNTAASDPSATRTPAGVVDDDGGDAGTPIGILAFGLIAGVLAVTAGGLAIRRGRGG